MIIQRRRLLIGLGSAATTTTRAAQGPLSRTTLDDASISSTPDVSGLEPTNVHHFGARGDGKHDDTTPIQMALDECGRRGGGIVQVSTGHYLIKTHLEIPAGVTLEGVFRAPPTFRTIDGGASPSPDTPIGPGALNGSVLLSVGGAGSASGTPFITLNTGSTLKGLTVFYPDQTDSDRPIAYPWTIAVADGGATNASVVDVLLVNSYQAVDFGSYNSSRCLIRNLYADALYRGIYVDNCFDVGRLENIHLAPFWQKRNSKNPLGSFTATHGEAYVFGRVDWLHVLNCFAVYFKVGFHVTTTSPVGVTRAGPSKELQEELAKSDYNSGNVVFTGGGIDLSATAVLIDDSLPMEGVSFCNCLFAGYVTINPTNRGMVRFTSCGFVNVSDTDTPLITTGGAGRVTFGDCSFSQLVAPHPQPKTTFIRATSGRVGVVNCTFTSSTLTHTDKASRSETAPTLEQHIVLDESVRSCVILGNDFSDRWVLVNHSNGNTQIDNNVDGSGVAGRT